MNPNIKRYCLIALLVGWCLQTGTYAQEPNRHIQLQSLSWGLSPGQTARISGVNFVFADGSVRSTIIMRIELLDMEGDVLAESSEINIAPGKTRFWDVPRESLRGGEATGRLQVRARILIRWQNAAHPPPIAPAVEVFDSGSGRTVMSFDSFLKIEGVPGESE
jgi:prepilin-type processing-associated H-X9-DG protein